MRKVYCAKALIGLLAIFAAVPSAAAEDIYNLYQNQTGFNLPGVTLPQGQDEVRAADGTTCRSAVGGSGAYMDIGVIRGAGRDLGQSAGYGRLIIPLEGRRARVDCTRLYELEVQRLQMEIRMLKMGGGSMRQDAAAQNWASDGWTTNGR